MDHVHLYFWILIFIVCLIVIWKMSIRSRNIESSRKSVLAKNETHDDAETRYNKIRASYNANHPVSRDAARLYGDLQVGKITQAYYNAQMDILLKKVKA